MPNVYEVVELLEAGEPVVIQRQATQPTAHSLKAYSLKLGAPVIDATEVHRNWETMLCSHSRTIVHKTLVSSSAERAIERWRDDLELRADELRTELAEIERLLSFGTALRIVSDS